MYFNVMAFAHVCLLKSILLNHLSTALDYRTLLNLLTNSDCLPNHALFDNIGIPVFRKFEFFHFLHHVCSLLQMCSVLWCLLPYS